MDILTREDLTSLAARQTGPRISIYLPTHRFGPQIQADQTVFRNVLREAERQLAAGGSRSAEIADLLAPAKALIDDRPFWQHSDLGLALFIGREGMRVFRLPETFAERVVIDDRFYLRPLLGLVGTDRHFWLLALSQKHVRLMRGSQQGLEEVDLEGVPESLAETLRFDDFEKASLQFHTGTTGTGGRRPAVFHGTGETDEKSELVRYFRQVDRGVAEYLQGDAAPLILAGVDYLLPIYREVNSHPTLAPAGVVGSPENTNPAALFERAWDIVMPLLELNRREASHRIDEAWGSSRTTSDPSVLVPAALHGRVETLLVSVDRELWGRYNAETDTVTITATHERGTDDLLELATFEALLSGAEVYAIPADDLTHGGTLAALLRY